MRVKDETRVHDPLRTVVVAGCSSGAGKTSVAEAVTQMLARQCRTAAAKITVTHGDRGCPHGGKGCNVCSSLGGDFQIILADSIITQPGTDTARLRLAGGSPVIWAITRDVALGSAWKGIKSHLESIDCVVIESNSLAEHLVPTLTLMVVDASVSRKIWKPSAERLIASSDYVVLNDRGTAETRDLLVREIKSLRSGLSDVIRVSHPHEITSHSGLLGCIQSRCINWV